MFYKEEENKYQEKEESEDEFDKLIGHIEGSRSNKKEKIEEKVAIDKDLEEEDFF